MGRSPRREEEAAKPGRRAGDDRWAEAGGGEEEGFAPVGVPGRGRAKERNDRGAVKQGARGPAGCYRRERTLKRASEAGPGSEAEATEAEGAEGAKDTKSGAGPPVRVEVGCWIAEARDRRKGDVGRGSSCDGRRGGSGRRGGRGGAEAATVAATRPGRRSRCGLGRRSRCGLGQPVPGKRPLLLEPVQVQGVKMRKPSQLNRRRSWGGSSCREARWDRR